MQMEINEWLFLSLLDADDSFIRISVIFVFK